MALEVKKGLIYKMIGRPSRELFLNIFFWDFSCFVVGFFSHRSGFFRYAVIFINKNCVNVLVKIFTLDAKS